MIKSVICILCAVVLVIINTIILFLKPEFTFAKNDEENYTLYYQKWIRTLVFMATIVIATCSIYFSVELIHPIATILLGVECILVIIYALCKYKGIVVDNDEINIQRLFRKDINTSFDNISSVTYIPNARLQVKLKRKGSFDVSFNFENFYYFYKRLIKENIKFKTGSIPQMDNHVYLQKYDLIINFPKTMFREFYQSEDYLRNSRYLFSARSLENNEHIEGYSKDSSKDLMEFIELIKNDLVINDFTFKSTISTNIGNEDFNIIRSVSNKNKEMGRLAYIYKQEGNYLIIYADYMLANEDEFMEKMNNAIHHPNYEDNKSKLSIV